jgi:hypothetical protein
MSSPASEPYSEFADNPEPVNNGFLGPSYPYRNNIKPPNEVGITSKSGAKPFIANIAGLISYGDLLLEGTGKASRTGKPLGNKFWYYTGARCKPLTDQSGIIWENSTDLNKDTHKEQEVNRYIFINNIPTGGLGFGDLSGSSIYKGLIPGTIQDLTAFSRLSIMNAFSGDSTPPCQYVNLETIDINNNVGHEGHYVALMDLKNMNDICKSAGSITYTTGSEHLPLYKCGTGNNPDPYSGTKTGFTNMNINTYSNKLPDNIIDQFFLLCICLVGIYILYKAHKYNK